MFQKHLLSLCVCVLITMIIAEAENSSPGVVIGVGIAGLVIGIAICGAVHFIVIRHRTRSNNR